MYYDSVFYNAKLYADFYMASSPKPLMLYVNTVKKERKNWTLNSL